MKNFFKTIESVDWILLFSMLMLVLFGLISMKSFGPPTGGLDGGAGGDYYFNRQIIWLVVSLLAFFLILFIDWTFFKTNSVFLLLLYAVVIGALVFVLIAGRTMRGVHSWIGFGSVRLEPAELMKPVLVLILAKYFSRRHIEIARVRTLVISGFYAALPAGLVLVQPDFGLAMVLGFLWPGMALIGGIKVRHLLVLFFLGAVSAFLFWNFLLLPYQKARVVGFLNPYSDTRGSGYHALQSMIAVGSGELVGRGIGFGTQSRLQFLPEHQTDFIFAAFAEEWGWVGVAILFFFFGVIVWRILYVGIYAESNFEKLYAGGLALFFFFQALIHVGMNTGILPITGLGFPLMSYGGSGLLVAFSSIGILQSFTLHRKGILLDTEDRYEEGIVGV